MTRKSLDALAAQHGAEIDTSEDDYTLEAYTPEGKVWKSNGASVLLVAFGNPADGQTWKPRAYADLAEMMRPGAEDAPDGYDGWWSE